MTPRAELIEKTPLRRTFDVWTVGADRPLRVKYNGMRFGFESVSVEGKEVYTTNPTTWCMAWLTPYLAFRIGEAYACIRIKTGFLPRIQAFALTVQGYRVYSEGDSIEDNCPSCGYNLGGMTSGLCPECGKLVAANKRVAVPFDDPGG